MPNVLWTFDILFYFAQYNCSKIIFTNIYKYNHIDMPINDTYYNYFVEIIFWTIILCKIKKICAMFKEYGAYTNIMYNIIVSKNNIFVNLLIFYIFY